MRGFEPRGLGIGNAQSGELRGRKFDFRSRLRDRFRPGRIRMIVCHCNLIDHTEIERATAQLRVGDRLKIVTPVMVYHALGKRPRCGGCLPLATSIMHSSTDAPEPCADCPLVRHPCEDLLGETDRHAEAAPGTTCVGSSA